MSRWWLYLFSKRTRELWDYADLIKSNHSPLEAWDVLNSLDPNQGWTNVKLEREWSFGDPETAHWLWTCTAERWTASGGIDSHIFAENLVAASSDHIDPAKAVLEAVSLALVSGGPDDDARYAASVEAVKKESEEIQARIDAEWPRDREADALELPF